MMQERKWRIPHDLLYQSVLGMRPHGRHGNEGLALWFGTNTGGRAAVTQLVIPTGPGFITKPDQLILSQGGMAALSEFANTSGLYLIGQIHSHPGMQVGLSKVDREWGIRYEAYLSVVCPYYAQRDVACLADCGVHVYERGGYRRIWDFEIAYRVDQSTDPVKVTHIQVPA